MSQDYKVSINKGDKYGYIAYNEESKQVSVVLDDAQTKSEIQEYLAQPHLIREPKSGSTIDFFEAEYLAARSKHDLQIVLTRMWKTIHVHVNWSIPVEFQ